MFRKSIASYRWFDRVLNGLPLIFLIDLWWFWCRGAQFSGTGSAWRLNCVRWHLILVSCQYMELILCHSSGAWSFDMSVRCLKRLWIPVLQFCKSSCWMSIGSSMYIFYTVFEGYVSPFLLDEYLYERWYTPVRRKTFKALYRNASEGGNCEYPWENKVGAIGFGDQRNPISEARAEIKKQPAIDKL